MSRIFRARTAGVSGLRQASRKRAHPSFQLLGPYGVESLVLGRRLHILALLVESTVGHPVPAASVLPVLGVRPFDVLEEHRTYGGGVPARQQDDGQRSSRIRFVSSTTTSLLTASASAI